jgi:hypothetical protein
MLRKSITFYYLAFLIFVSLDWFFGNTVRSWDWIAIGATIGLIIEIIGYRIGNKSHKNIKIIEAILLSICGYMVLLSKWVPELLGIAGGIIILIIIRQLSFQFYWKKVITWEEDIQL